MIVYDGLKSDFLRSVQEDTLAEEIEQCVLQRLGHPTVQNEFMSGVNSDNSMYKVLSDPGIPENAGVAIEYNIPQTAKRVDFMISGYDAENHPDMVIVELKQWSSLEKVAQSETLVETFVGGSNRRVVHPSYQAWSYAQLISDYNASVQDAEIQLHPCVCMHNYQRKTKDPVDSKQYSTYTEEAPVFTMGQAGFLRDFIRKYIRTGDHKRILYQMDHGRIRPSKQLQDAIASMIRGNREFIMIDEQQVAYEDILRLSKQCQKDGKKRTVICQGGPGTGKSVIAVRLLAELTQENQLVQYTSKNSAPRQVYAAKLKGEKKKSSVTNMFKGSGSYVDVPDGMIDTILADEAHRLNEKSGLFHNQVENQIKEIIVAAKCSVFFIDESQRVTMDDIGSVEEIQQWAAEEHSEVTKMELASQFRCNGSNVYLAFVDDLLDIRRTANQAINDLEYDFRVCDTPQEMQNLILEKNRMNNRSRILAGYCWDWPKKHRSDPDYHDIQIGDYGISWNLDDGQAFALSEDSVNEAGCIHTTQGLEFDYVGVIIGDDLRYENGRIVTDFHKRASTDQSIRGLKTLYKAHPEEADRRADEIIKNTYRTLMTRGMKGCYVYCTDPGLQMYLRRRLSVYADEVGKMTKNSCAHGKQTKR